MVIVFPFQPHPTSPFLYLTLRPRYSLLKFKADMQLVFSNGVAYNNVGTVGYNASLAAKDYFETEWTKLLHDQNVRLREGYAPVT